MDRGNGIYGKNLYEQDLKGLAELCANVANNPSADVPQADTAHALRVKWIRLGLDHASDGKEDEVLKKRMLEFLSGIPAWMMSGI